MEGSHALASQVTGWMLATQVRLGMSGQARASLAALKEQEARSGEARNADAVICHRGPNARPVCDPDPRSSRRHGAVGVTPRWCRGGTARTQCLPGLLDRSAMYVLAEIEALGLDLVEVRHPTPQRQITRIR